MLTLYSHTFNCRYRAARAAKKSIGKCILYPTIQSMMVGRLMLPMLIFYWPLHSIDHRLIGILSAILDKRLKTTKKFKWSNWARVHPHYWKTSQELRMLSSVTINCQVTKIVINPGSQLSVL